MSGEIEQCLEQERASLKKQLAAEVAIESWRVCASERTSIQKELTVERNAAQAKEIEELLQQLAECRAILSVKEDHCSWLAGMVENWSDEEITTHSHYINQTSGTEALEEMK